MSFVNDQRNYGGRFSLKKSMINHVSSLINARSAIKIIPSTILRVDHNKNKDIKFFTKGRFEKNQRKVTNFTS